MCPAQTHLEAPDFAHGFAGTVAVDHLDLQISAGDAFGLLRPNSAGR